jgi:hypothetical protein
MKHPLRQVSANCDTNCDTTTKIKSQRLSFFCSPIRCCARGLRYFGADQECIVPPFSLYATEDEATIMPVGNEVVEGVSSEIWKVEDKTRTIPLHTMWIGTIDRLPNEICGGELAKPRGAVAFSGYGDQFAIQMPCGALFPKEGAPELIR